MWTEDSCVKGSADNLCLNPAIDVYPSLYADLQINV